MRCQKRTRGVVARGQRRVGEAKLETDHHNAHDDLVAAIRTWADDVRARECPREEHTYPIADAVLRELQAKVQAKVR